MIKSDNQKDIKPRNDLGTTRVDLCGEWDLSIINTPPPNRQPIITELHTLNEELIKEEVEYELERGGQIFVIHNRVQNISEVAI